MALMDLLNGGTHAVTSRPDSTQLKSIILRVESLQVFLLSVQRLN